jgi:hypothetical protein
MSYLAARNPSVLTTPYAIRNSDFFQAENMEGG